MPRKARSRANRKKEKPQPKKTNVQECEVSLSEDTQQVVDEPFPDIPQDLTGSFVTGDAQIDLLNALEEDVDLPPTSDLLNAPKGVSHSESVIEAEPVSEAEPLSNADPVSDAEPVSGAEHLDDANSKHQRLPKLTKETVFDEKSLDVLQKLFQSPQKYNFPMPQSAMSASVFEAENFAPMGIVANSHENCFDSRPFTRPRRSFSEEPKPEVAAAQMMVAQRPTSYLDEFDETFQESLPDLEAEFEENLQVCLPELDAGFTGNTIDDESLPDLESDFDPRAIGPPMNSPKDYEDHEALNHNFSLRDKIDELEISNEKYEEDNEVMYTKENDDLRSENSFEPNDPPQSPSTRSLGDELIPLCQGENNLIDFDEPLFESDTEEDSMENEVSIDYRLALVDLEGSNSKMVSSPTHSSSILRHLQELQKNEIGVDLGLRSEEGNLVWIHSFVIQGLVGRKINERILECPFGDVFISAAVYFFYQNRLYLSIENADTYLSICDFFGGIDSMEMIILDYLCQSISDTNYTRIMSIAEKYNKSNLQDLILNKISAHVAEYEIEIMNLSPENFIDLLRRHDLSVASEETVVSLVKRWILADRSRGDWLPKVLDCVRFSCLNPDFIVNEIASDALFSGPCSASIMQAMSYHLLVNSKYENPLSKSHPRGSTTSVLIVGVSSDGIQMNRFKEDQWSEVPSGLLPPSVTSFEVINVEGFAFILGGEILNSETGKKISTSMVFVYDPRLGELRETSSMITGRTHFACAAVNGKIYVFGGRSESGILRENEVFDIKNAKWSKIRSLEFGRCCHDASVIGTDVILSGGYVQGQNGISKYTSSVILYDTICGLWKPVGELSSPRGWHKSVSFDGDIYVFGGYYQTSTQRVPVEAVEKISLVGYVEPFNLDLNITSSPGLAVSGSTVYLTGGWDEKWRRYSQVCFAINLETKSVEKMEMRLPNSINYHQTILLQL